MGGRYGRRALWIAGTAVVTIVLAGALGYAFYEPGWRYDIRGVDVSHHQGEIDWRRLRLDRTEFAYIKATEGGDWVDPRFAENWERAQDAGVVVGAYHYFTLCTPGAEQAANFIATVPQTSGALPPAVDLEFAGNCADRPTGGTLRSELRRFITEVEAHYETTMVIYVLPDFYERYLADDPPDAIWWAMSPVLEPWGDPDWTFWQHFPGRRDGVDGRVDRNVFRGTRAEFAELLAP